MSVACAEPDASSHDVAGLGCRFGDGVLNELTGEIEPVPALWVSASELRCVTPAHAPGSVSLALTANGGADFSAGAQGEATVRFVSQLALLSVSPASGPVTGGTMLTLRGTAFRNTAQLGCRFVVETCY